MDAHLTSDPARAHVFPGAGRRFLASFPEFRFELNFESASSLTWTQVGPDGSLGRSESVAISTESVSESIHVVAWQERSGTTVVQVADFARGIVLTHISRPDLTFIRTRGRLAELPAAT